MNAGSSVSPQTLTLLAATLDLHGLRQGSRIRIVALSLCMDAVAFAQESEPGWVGTVGSRARGAAHLLLDLICPDLDDTIVRELAVACERAAILG